MNPKKQIKKVGGFSEVKKPTTWRMPLPQYEPMRRFRHLLELPLGDRLLTFFVHTERPSMILRTPEYGFNFRSDFNVMTQQEWGPIRINFMDLVGNNTTPTEAMEALQTWFGDVSNGQYARTYKKNITIQQIDPTGVVTESWHLIGAFPSMININYAYTDGTDYNGVQNLEMTLMFDHCVINF